MVQKQLSKRAYQAFTLLSRRVNWLMRQQLLACPITVQQCYALESLMKGHKSMNALASDMAIHQSTLTRIVEKLEKQGFIIRTRKPGNQRMVEVRLTETGRLIYQQLYNGTLQTISNLLEQVPAEKQETLVSAMEAFLSIIDPESQTFQDLLKTCCTEEIFTENLIKEKRG
ncbi:MAG: MarR family transcriptional regulator [Deltaproteobacteria bacterium]|nr:MarR family transcriptional regulator [Deltaproteobacteria bacterium]